MLLDWITLCDCSLLQFGLGATIREAFVRIHRRKQWRGQRNAQNEGKREEGGGDGRGGESESGHFGKNLVKVWKMNEAIKGEYKGKGGKGAKEMGEFEKAKPPLIH
jgi:hypothetical protein